MPYPFKTSLSNRYRELLERDMWIGYRELYKDDITGNPSGDKFLKVIELFWQELVKNYSQINRYYHSLTHIEKMVTHLFSLFYFNRWDSEYTDFVEYCRSIRKKEHLEAFEIKYRNFTEDIRNLAWAIFYHDIVYDPTRNDNEEQSAEFFANRFQKYLPSESVERVVELILATKNHECSDPHDLMMTYFLDLDLSILGSSEEEYQDYAYNIRQEYRHLSDEDYRKGRIAVLEKFLQRERLYFTDWFYKRLEQQARQNLQAEIEFLKSWE